MGERVAIDIGGILPGRRLDIPRVEFRASGGKTGAVNGVDAFLDYEREGVTVREVECEQTDKDEKKAGETVLAVWWKSW